MSDRLLTLNAGSSSLKFALFEHDAGSEQAIVRGQVGGLGGRSPRLTVHDAGGAALADAALIRDPDPEAAAADPRLALAAVIAWLDERFPGLAPAAIGHRVVHGGIDHEGPVAIDDRVFAALDRLSPLAPLHQPHNLAGIRAARKAWPGVPQIACFDTAFHRGHSFVNDVFALPRRFYDEGVRRYGFHGLSYEYIAARLRERAPREACGRIAVAHLGNGASICALRAGVSIGSTMGFTALDGLPMGTRCGQIDPGVVLWLMQQKGLDADEVTALLYNESGLKGLSGISGDMRELLASEAPEAKQAVDYYVTRVRRELGAMAALAGGLDGIVFTGGIGENAAPIRSMVLADMRWLGIEIDAERNRLARAADDPVITTDGAAVTVRVMATDEERMIARHCAGMLRSG